MPPEAPEAVQAENNSLQKNGDEMKKIGMILVLVSVAFLVAVQGSPAQDPMPLKVALVFGIGGRGDGGFNDAAYDGLEKPYASWG